MADFIIKNVRLSFPDLWHAVEFKTGDGKPRWNATALVEPGSDADKLIRAEIAAEAKATWGEKAPQVLKSLEGQKNQYCYLDGDTKTYDGYAGMWALSAHRNAKMKNGAPNTPPLIIDRNKAALTADSGKPYAGCYVNMKVSVYCQKGENPGVRASFSVVQFAGDGDAFSTSAPKADDMDDLSDGVEADALDGMDAMV